MKNVTTNLNNLKIKVDRLDVDKIVPALVDLSKLCDVVKNDVIKKDAKIKNIEDKIPDITNLATTTTTLNAKINEVKNKILNITDLATTADLTAVENKIPNVSNLVKKTDYNTKISETKNEITTDDDHNKCNTTQEFNKLESFSARLAQSHLASESDIANFVKIRKFKH